MMTELDILIQNLRSKDYEIRLLALDTLSRYKFQSGLQSDYLLKIQEILIELGPVNDVESQHLVKAVIENLKVQTIGANDHLQNPKINASDEMKLAFHTKDLESSDPKVRKQCLIKVITHEHTKAYNGILSMLINEEDESVISLAIKALSAISEPKIIKLLQVFIYHSNQDVRRSAMLAISELGNYSEIIDLILPSINLSDEEEIVNISDILAKFEPQDIFSHMKDKLLDAREHRRLLTVKSLSKLEGEEAINLINISANDRSPQVKLLALQALLGRTQSHLIMPILNRLAQDPDIEVSEIALHNLKSYSNQALVERIKLSGPQNASTNQSMEIEEETPEESPILKKSEKINLTDSSNVDDEIETEFLDLGEVLYRKITAGDISDISLTENVASVERKLERVSQLEQRKQKVNLVKSIQKAIGGNLDDKLTLHNAKISLEEAYIDLGEAGFNLICTGKLSIQSIESSISRLKELFILRKELPTTIS